MTANEGLTLLQKMEHHHQHHIITNDTIACVIARAGSPNPLAVADTIPELITRDYGPPLHTLVIPGKLHFMEIEALELCATLPHQLAKKLQKL